MHALDVGVDSEDAARLASEYAYNWWDEAQEPDEHEILSRATFKKCMKKHRECLLADSANLHNDDLADPLPFAVGPLVKGRPQVTAAAAAVPAMPSGPHRSSADRHSLQQDVARLRQDLQSCGVFSTSQATSFEHNWDVSMRRAAGFHILHQMAIQKELGSAPMKLATPVATLMRPSASTTRSKASTTMGNQAQAELKRLQALPAESHKWTWGVDLTEEDVLSIEHMRYKSMKNSHSDYNLSLSYKGLHPHPLSSSPRHSLLDTAVFSSADEGEEIPPFPSDAEPAPLNIGRFDPLSRYPSPSNSKVAGPSISQLPLEAGIDSRDILAIADDWNDDDDDSNSDIAAIADEWDDADSASGDEADSQQTSALDPEIAAAVRIWATDDSSSSGTSGGSAKSDISMQNMEALDEFDQAARLWQSGDDSASASDEEVDDSIDPTHLRVSPSKITVDSPFGEGDFGYVDETYLNASQFEQDINEDNADADYTEDEEDEE